MVHNSDSNDQTDQADGQTGYDVVTTLLTKGCQ